MLVLISVVAVAIRVWPVVLDPLQNLVDELRYDPQELRIIRTLREFEQVEAAGGIEIDNGPLSSLPSREYWEEMTEHGRSDVLLPNTGHR